MADTVCQIINISIKLIREIRDIQKNAIKIEERFQILIDRVQSFNSRLEKFKDNARFIPHEVESTFRDFNKTLEDIKKFVGKYQPQSKSNIFKLFAKMILIKREDIDAELQSYNTKLDNYLENFDGYIFHLVLENMFSLTSKNLRDDEKSLGTNKLKMLNDNPTDQELSSTVEIYDPLENKNIEEIGTQGNEGDSLSIEEITCKEIIAEPSSSEKLSLIDQLVYYKSQIAISWSEGLKEISDEIQTFISISNQLIDIRTSSEIDSLLATNNSILIINHIIENLQQLETSSKQNNQSMSLLNYQTTKESFVNLLNVFPDHMNIYQSFIHDFELHKHNFDVYLKILEGLFQPFLEMENMEAILKLRKLKTDLEKYSILSLQSYDIDKTDDILNSNVSTILTKKWNNWHNNLLVYLINSDYGNDVIKFILDNQLLTINELKSYGLTVLQALSLNSNKSIRDIYIDGFSVNELLENGLTIKVLYDNGFTINELLNNGLSLKILYENKLTILDFYQNNVSFDKIQELLFEACNQENIDLFNEIISSAYFINSNDLFSLQKDGQSIIYLAKDPIMNMILLTLLKDKYDDLNKEDKDIIRNEWKENRDDLHKIKDLIERKGFRDIDMPIDEDGRNAFMYACYSGNLETVKYLIENPIYSFKDMLDMRDNYGFNSFMTACGYNKLDIIKYFIENPICSYKEMLIERDNNGRNAFMIACGYSKLEIIKYLIETPIFPYKNMLTERDNDGRNAFMIACSYNKLEIIKYLIEDPLYPYKNMLTERDNNGKTVFEIAYSQNIRDYILSIRR